ncbi:MAG: protein GlmU [Desulfobacterales bacterium]|nr:protein GlmU [Desulfobacterales bacterium]
MAAGIVEKLIEKGVEIPNPGAVTVGEEVDVDRISGNGVVLFPGCRLAGASTLILDHVRIGTEGPVALTDCRVGKDTALSAGAFEQTVFLGKNKVGPGAYFREGTILEEGAGAAHCVGLKQTVLFPFVTLGSLINFCDCLMAGGTGPKHHSEVGSSFIHFNFTPNQDKATPSLIGDVPRGVMLDRDPIFLGGQGGLVGPCRVAFGTVTASGAIVRKDVDQEGRLVFEAPRRSFSVPNLPGLYRSIRRILENNLIYIGNLKALQAWYSRVRPLFAAEPMARLLIEGLQAVLALNLEERIGRLGQLVDKISASLAVYQELMGKDASAWVVAEKKELIDRWPEVAAVLGRPSADIEDPELRDRFLGAVASNDETQDRYVASVQGFSPAVREDGVRWLQAIVDRTVSEAFDRLETLKAAKQNET